MVEGGAAVKTTRDRPTAERQEGDPNEGKWGLQGRRPEASRAVERQEGSPIIRGGSVQG